METHLISLILDDIFILPKTLTFLESKLRVHAKRRSYLIYFFLARLYLWSFWKTKDDGRHARILTSFIYPLCHCSVVGLAGFPLSTGSPLSISRSVCLSLSVSLALGFQTRFIS